MKSKVARNFAVLLLAFIASAFGINNTAFAAEPDCKTVSSHLVDRPDNGHGTPSVWALDTVTRTVKICHDATTEVPAGAVAVQTWNYTATLTDTGTFVTKGSVHGSPNDGHAIVAGVHGTVTGEATFAKFTAPHDWAYFDASKLDGKTFNGSNPSGTNDWLKNLWTDGLGKTGIDTYKWVYKTCSEQWVDSSDKDNDDGQGANAGDITGKACPSPSPSASATKVATPTASPAASLPVTGPGNTTALVGLGSVAVLIGASLVIGLRMRNKPVFKAE